MNDACSATAVTTPPSPAPIQDKKQFSTSRVLAVCYFLILCFLGIGLVLPMGTLITTSFQTPDRQWAGLENLVTYTTTPGLMGAFWHTLNMGLLVTAGTLLLAFTLAYAFTHARIKGEAGCRLCATLPLFVPSLFPALGLIYLLGNQGILSEYIEDIPLYGPLGIFLGAVLYTLPHATLLLVAALRDIDRDLYLAARTLGASGWRRFYTITLPGVRYGLTSAGIVVFVLTITDFGIPKVLGGNYSMLATEIYIQIVGMQNFPMGATVSLVLLCPALFAFALDRWAHSKQRGKNKGRPFIPEASPLRDMLFTGLSWLIASLPLCITSLVLHGAFITFWPYDMTFTLINFSFKESVYGVAPFFNSLLLAGSVAVLGTLITFGGAYLTERTSRHKAAKGLYRILALLPLGIPGTVLGLAFILSFNAVSGPLNLLFSGMSILVFNTLIHFFTVCHLNTTGSLLRLAPHYEAAGATLGAPLRRTFFRVICPLQKQTLAETALYLFVNAMTTISGVVFLYTADTIPASVSILHLLDTGRIAEASAMGSLILCVALVAHGLFLLFTRKGTPSTTTTAASDTGAA